MVILDFGLVTEFEDERATNVELGIKATLGGQVEVNVAAVDPAADDD